LSTKKKNNRCILRILIYLSAKTCDFAAILDLQKKKYYILVSQYVNETTITTTIDEKNLYFIVLQNSQFDFFVLVLLLFRGSVHLKFEIRKKDIVSLCVQRKELKTIFSVSQKTKTKKQTTQIPSSCASCHLHEDATPNAMCSLFIWLKKNHTSNDERDENEKKERQKNKKMRGNNTKTNLSGCCSRRACGRPPIVYQQRSNVADPGELLIEIDYK
jgi:hypothetical protein